MRWIFMSLVSAMSVIALMGSLGACGEHGRRVDNCASSGVQVRIDGQTRNLLSCAGKAGQAVPIVLPVGRTASILVHNGQRLSLTVQPTGIVTLTDRSLRAGHPGRATVFVSGPTICAAATPSCSLLQVVVPG
jgi:hypothetical protein